MKTIALPGGLLWMISAVSMAADHREMPPSAWSVHGVLELQLSQTDSLDTWLNDGGTGKFRFDNSDNKQLKPGSNGLHIRYELAATSKLHGVALYNHDPDRELAVTELFWHYRPLPDGAWRHDYKAGSFYPPMSLENTAPLWTSPYSVTPSVINSWIGEELRTLGVQGRWTHRGRYSGSPHDVTLTAALFGGNDPTGALLAWRGWVKTDRQTGLGQAVAIADLPTFAPGQVFAKQDREIAPFREIDNRPGFYVGTEWSYQQRFKLGALYYDNQADASLLEDGQYAWRTRFSHLSMRLSFADSWQLLGQIIDGDTRMGPGAMVDAPFRAAYLMLVKKRQQQRLSLQIEEFAVKDSDTTAMDSNNERGTAATAAWSFRPVRQWQLTLQGSYIESNRKQRHYTGLDTNTHDTQLLGSARYHW